MATDTLHPSTTTCLHCSAPCSPTAAGAEGPFCCRGCAGAYALIHSHGLDRFYTMCPPDSCQPPVASPDRDHAYSEFDVPAVLARTTTDAGGSARVSRLALRGIHCGACVWLLERLPRLETGVIDARVNLHHGTITIRWDSAQTSLSTIARTIASLGYSPGIAGDAARAKASDRREIVNLGIAGACAGNAMLYAVGLYAGLFQGIDPTSAALFRWLSLGVTALSIAWPGRVFLANAWAAIRTRTPHLDLPISLALVAGAVWSTISTIRGTGEVYFDSLSVLVFALLVGRYLQSRRQAAGLAAVESLFAMTARTARRVSPGGVLEDVPTESLSAGDLIEVAAGDTVPADGTVESGTTTIDASLMTGESRACPVHAGSTLFAGVTNLSAPVRVRVTAAGAATRLAAIMRLVEDAATRRAPIVRLADRLTGAFVVGMLALAIATFVVYRWVNPGLALERAVALLVVTCPCALGLATPLTMVVALGRAAKRGILIKGADAVQLLAEPATVCLDKTGTLTSGTPKVLRWLGDPAWRPLVAALEHHTRHPIASALREGYPASDPSLPVDHITHELGGGISGTVGTTRLCVGSVPFVRAQLSSIDAEHPLLLAAQNAAGEGMTPVLIAADGRPVALAALGDQVRPDAAESIAALRAMGHSVRILSGDDPHVVASVAALVGVADAHGGLSPEGKLALVRDALSRGRVIFVGDGVNDAAALAAASVGVAVHSGAEAAMAAADVYLSREGLSPLVDLCQGAQDAIRTIRLNLALSFTYNLVAIGGTLAGFVSPLLAALIMPLSSITVLTVALRSGAFRDTQTPARHGTTTLSEIPPAGSQARSREAAA